jgi:hypothetical protein
VNDKTPTIVLCVACALCLIACAGAGDDSNVFDPIDPDGDTGSETGIGDDGDDGDSGIPKFDLGDPGDPDGSCEKVVVQAAAARPHVLFVLDKSGSMTDAQWIFQNQLMSRWHSLYLAVESVLDQFDDRADFGAALYPNFDDGCVVDDPVNAPVAPNNGLNILAAMPPPGSLFDGPTPLHNGISVAKAHLEEIRVPEKPQAMVLVADGGLSQHCPPISSLEEVNAMIAEAWADDVPTFVLGIDANTPELIEQLNDYADSGGKALNGANKFYNADDGDELLENVLEVVQGTLSCTVTIEETPDNPAFTKVIVDGMEWDEVEECDSEDGWYWSNPFTELTMCGLACEDFKATGVANIEFLCTEG